MAARSRTRVHQGQDHVGIPCFALCLAHSPTHPTLFPTANHHLWWVSGIRRSIVVVATTAVAVAVVVAVGITTTVVVAAAVALVVVVLAVVVSIVISIIVAVLPTVVVVVGHCSSGCRHEANKQGHYLFVVVIGRIRRVILCR